MKKKIFTASLPYSKCRCKIQQPGLSSTLDTGSVVCQPEQFLHRTHCWLERCTVVSPRW